MNNEHKVVGYFAHSDRIVFCDDDACIIRGTESSLRTQLAERPKQFEIRKARYGDILFGILHGAPYSFDLPAYERFLPLARCDGLMFMDPPPGTEVLDCVRIQLYAPHAKAMDLHSQAFPGAT